MERNANYIIIELFHDIKYDKIDNTIILNPLLTASLSTFSQ